MTEFLARVEKIERLIYRVRGQKVMLDWHLAQLYGVTTKALNQAVKRNPDRFPEDFIFRLTRDELAELNRSQIVTGPRKHRDPRHLPYVFTQEGVGALSGVLRGPRAAEAYVYIMRAFVRQRNLLAAYPEIFRRLEELERKNALHDTHLRALFLAMRKYLAPAVRPRRSAGFLPPKKT